jgi:ribonuclease P protein component
VDQRLTKAERIRRRPDFLRVQGGGRKFHSASFVCFAMLLNRRLKADAPIDKRASGSLPGSDTELCRLGITVSRRVGGAVVRNRVKRLVREAFRRHKPLFPAAVELVVIARAEAAHLAYAQVERELCEISRRIAGGGAIRGLQDKCG